MIVSEMPMNLVIHPYFGVGEILLGNTAEQIREVIARPFRSFKKVPSSPVPADHFLGIGVIIFYKPPHICDYIELNPPAKPTFQGRTLLGEAFHPIRSRLNQIDKETILDGASIVFFGLGTGPTHHRSSALAAPRRISSRNAASQPA
jgi:hypothetical protein